MKLLADDTKKIFGRKTLTQRLTKREEKKKYLETLKPNVVRYALRKSPPPALLLFIIRIARKFGAFQAFVKSSDSMGITGCSSMDGFRIRRATAPKNNSTANNRGISSDNWRTRGETKFLEMNHYSLDYVARGDE